MEDELKEILADLDDLRGMLADPDHRERIEKVTRCLYFQHFLDHGISRSIDKFIGYVPAEVGGNIFMLTLLTTMLNYEHFGVASIRRRSTILILILLQTLLRYS